MHCPKCGQQQVSEETRFCSRCGFLLTGVAKVVANDGLLPNASNTQASNSMSPRRRGVMQGTFFFLLGFLVVPLLVIITIMLRAQPTMVIIATIIFTMGGLLRAAYALMFEPAEPNAALTAPEQQFDARLTNNAANTPALAGETAIPAAVYSAPGTGMWRDTNELVAEPGSVTESTTRLLEKDQ